MSTELHIGTKFGIENCKADLASIIAQTSLDLSNLATSCNTKSKISRVPRSRRNDVLLRCADVVIDIMQCLKSANGDLLNSTVPVQYDEPYFDEPRLCEFYYGICWLFMTFGEAIDEYDDDVDEAHLEKIINMCSLATKTVCVVPIALGVNDLEPYILERISEHNK